MPTLHTFEDSLRAHDLAVMRWLRGLTIDYGTISGAPLPSEPILAAMVGPTQAFGQIPDLMIERKWVTAATPDLAREYIEEHFPVLPLPLVTIVREDPILRGDMGGVPKRDRHLHFDASTGLWNIHPYPGAWAITYQLSFWSLKRYTDNYIREWIMGQLGQLGSSEGEIMLPVLHKAPWGEMLQSFKFQGSARLDEIEGVKQRYIRTDITFELKAWIMKPIVAQVESVAQIERTWCLDDLSAHTLPTAPSLSPNLFRLPLVLRGDIGNWPVEGAAIVEQSSTAVGKQAGLILTLTDDNDAVPLADGPIAPDVYGTGVVLVELDYEYHGPVSEAQVIDMEGSTVLADGQTPVLMYGQALTPAVGKQTATALFPVIGGLFRVSLVGRAGNTAQRIGVTNIRVRVLTRLDTLAATSIVKNGAVTEYRWTGLSQFRPHAVIGLLNAAFGGSGLVSLSDDATSPQYTRSTLADTADNVGFALTLQPQTDSLLLEVPDAIRLTAVYATRYPGPLVGA